MQLWLKVTRSSDRKAGWTRVGYDVEANFELRLNHTLSRGKQVVPLVSDSMESRSVVNTMEISLLCDANCQRQSHYRSIFHIR